MDERNEYSFESMFDFLILNTLSQEPLGGFALEQRIQRIRKMLEWMAARKGQTALASTAMALRRLEREGWLELKCDQADLHGENVYGLTSAGTEHLELERAHRAATLASFVESGAWDHSFRQFLNRGDQ